MEVTGKVIQITPIQEGTSRTGNPWRKRMYVIETQEGSFPRKVAFTVFGTDRVANMEATVQLGMMVRVSFDLESREYNDRWYTDASAWRIEPAQAAAPAAAPQQPMQQPQAYGQPAYPQAGAPVPPPPAAPAVSNSDDDLPF